MNFPPLSHIWINWRDWRMAKGWKRVRHGRPSSLYAFPPSGMEQSQAKGWRRDFLLPFYSHQPKMGLAGCCDGPTTIPQLFWRAYRIKIAGGVESFLLVLLSCFKLLDLQRRKVFREKTLCGGCEVSLFFPWEPARSTTYSRDGLGQTQPMKARVGVGSWN